VVDHPRDVAGTAPDGMEPEAGRSSLHDRGDAAGTTLVQHGVTRAPCRWARGVSSGQLLDDDLNETLEVDWGHVLYRSLVLTLSAQARDENPPDFCRNDLADRTDTSEFLE
jgi:hypothetical protein